MKDRNNKTLLLFLILFPFDTAACIGLVISQWPSIGLLLGAVGLFATKLVIFLMLAWRAKDDGNSSAKNHKQTDPRRNPTTSKTAPPTQMWELQWHPQMPFGGLKPPSQRPFGFHNYRTINFDNLNETPTEILEAILDVLEVEEHYEEAAKIRDELRRRKNR